MEAVFLISLKKAPQIRVDWEYIDQAKIKFSLHEPYTPRSTTKVGQPPS